MNNSTFTIFLLESALLEIITSCVVCQKPKLKAASGRATYKTTFGMVGQAVPQAVKSIGIYDL